jgi:hypothetical protein
MVSHSNKNNNKRIRSTPRPLGSIYPTKIPFVFFSCDWHALGYLLFSSICLKQYFRNFSVSRCLQVAAPYKMFTEGCFAGSKVTKLWSLPLTSIRLHLSTGTDLSFYSAHSLASNQEFSTLKWNQFSAPYELDARHEESRKKYVKNYKVL